MRNCQYDITYYDFNPTVLFVSKGRMTKDSRYHDHDFTEITYVLSGKGQYCVDGTVYDVQAGDLIICNSGVFHRNIVVNPKEPTVEFFVGFTDYHFRNMPENTIILKENGFILHTDTELRQNLSKLCFSMSAENETDQVGKYFMLKAHLIQFLLLILRQEAEPKPIQDGFQFDSHYKSYAVSRIVDYLDSHYNEKISLDRIAQNMYLSPVYISKIFKEETGESPINYLIKIRLEKAKDMLSSPQAESIKKIANDVGYEDAYHFSKLFKKYYGVSPLHYKKKIS
ncbi:MAG: AraC family transcriptional regulator [Lachnospiraceae bacterium]|nr:AraC family transcriptional regulator [Lachnospiraceae bacterium]